MNIIESIQNINLSSYYICMNEDCKVYGDITYVILTHTIDEPNFLSRNIYNDLDNVPDSINYCRTCGNPIDIVFIDDYAEN